MENILKVARRELDRIYRRPLYLIGLLIAPLILSILIPRIYAGRVVTDIPTVIVDLDKSALSRQVIRMADQHRFLKVSITSENIEQAVEKLHRNQAQVMVVFPKDFEKDVKTGKGASLGVYDYGANLLIGNLVYKAVTEIILPLNGAITAKKLIVSRGESAYTLEQFPPLALDIRNLFNPAFSYLNFLPPGALIALFQMIIMMIAATLITSELKTGQNELGSFSLTEIMLGKSLPLFTIMVIFGIFLFYGVFPVAQIPVKGSFLLILFIWIIFVIINIMAGILISLIAGDEMLATEAAVFITAPAFAFSGYTYPLSELPTIHQWFAQIMPSTHFIPLFIQAMFQDTLLHHRLNTWMSVMFLFLIELIAIIVLVRLNKNPFAEIAGRQEV
ncbi:MAG: ABC transporter permease [Calditrichia bacterium]